MFPQTCNPCGELTSRTLDPNPASLRGWGRSEAAGREPVSAQLSYNKAGSSVGNQTNSKDEIELLCYRGGVALINHWLRPGLEVDPAVPRRSKLSKTQCCFYLTSTVHNSSCTTTWSKHILHSLPCVHTGTQHHASQCQMPSERPTLPPRMPYTRLRSTGRQMKAGAWGEWTALWETASIERAQHTSCIYHRGLTASGISCFYFSFQTLASCYWCITCS